jgi:hydroxymethylglutaryl-CoA reductase
MENSTKQSIWSGFYKKSIAQRQQILAKERGLLAEDIALLNKEGPLPLAIADTITENVIGTFALPFSVAPNFLINGKEYVVPMVIEEPSVVAAASNAAKMAREKGGFKAEYSGSIMTGQIQLVGEDISEAEKKIQEAKSELISKADLLFANLKAYGGGAVGMQVRRFITPRGQMLVVEFDVNVVDAMGANMINSAMEQLAPTLEEKSGLKARLRILTNLSMKRIASASAVWSKEILGGEDAVEAILDAWAFAMADPYRRATHHKGIMNGIDAVAIATGNDWRAIEAGAHAYAAMKDASITTYAKTKEGDLAGKIVLPLAVGTVGGSMKANPCAVLGQKILGAKSSAELAQVMAAVGLAQNLAALKALAGEGIQAGHMRLHARHIAKLAGAKDDEIDKVVEAMIMQKQVSQEKAKEILGQIRKTS